MAAVRSPIGSALQFSALAFATSRLNWSCPLKTVLNGNRDSYANATEQTKNRGTITLQLRITPTTQRGIWLRSMTHDEARKNDEAPILPERTGHTSASVIRAMALI